ncbi:hypothetical protein [Polaribacter sp. KT 15]|uniref:hypothetical protein n=1 Tax=Polaribacter sp. KT 15 TaxID=1896175 RepID=UPI0009099BC9|nr:hypothetical protein [Polaribacter sp. KT 15]SHN04897.1 hypothetical protein SAMN05720268_2429 [Polaribacter sp. KT 15]
MSQTAIKPSRQIKPYNNDVVIQVTKAQLTKFLQFIMIISMATINILAYKTTSPLLKDLIISQVILVLIYFIKNSKLNTIIK